MWVVLKDQTGLIHQCAYHVWQWSQSTSFLKEWVDVDLHMYSLACAWQIIWIRKILHAETNKKQLQPPQYAKMNQRNILPRTLIYLQKWWLLNKPFLLKWSLFKRHVIILFFRGVMKKMINSHSLPSEHHSLHPLGFTRFGQTPPQQLAGSILGRSGK